MGSEISIEVSGLTLSQLLYFQAVVLPELKHVLDKYEKDLKEMR